MSFILKLPQGFEYVILSGVATLYLNAWQGIKVGRQRKKAGIKYPQMYAEKAEMQENNEAKTFNNLQRAHQSTVESYPQLLLAMFVSGFKYPHFAASAGAIWVIGRVLYTLGYEKGPEYRNSRGGALFELGSLSLLLCATYTGISLVRERIGI